MVKVIRLILGLALCCSATGFLIEGGMSRFARSGIPARTDWGLILIGLVMAGAGGWLLRRGDGWTKR